MLDIVLVLTCKRIIRTATKSERRGRDNWLVLFASNPEVHSDTKVYDSKEL